MVKVPKKLFFEGKGKFFGLTGALFPKKCYICRSLTAVFTKKR